MGTHLYIMYRILYTRIYQETMTETMVDDGMQFEKKIKTILAAKILLHWHRIIILIIVCMIT